VLNVTPTGYRYTSQRWDSGLGLYDYNARYYDPHIGRFISADTLVPDPAAPQAFNRYAYVLGNPLRYTDPTGHIPIPAIVLLLAMVGTTVGVLNYMQASDLNLQANPVSFVRGAPNAVMEIAGTSTGLGIGAEAGVAHMYHFGSDTYATCLVTCSEFTSEILSISGSVSFVWTDASTAQDAARGYTISGGLGVGPVNIAMWNTAVPELNNNQWHPPLVKDTSPGTTGFAVSTGLSISPISVFSSTCHCNIIAQGYFHEISIPYYVQALNFLHDYLME
jgi:RHS repeat-associated protein